MVGHTTDDENGVILVTAPEEAHEQVEEWIDWIYEQDNSDLSGKEFVVATPNMEINELPALDDYADELADRVAERVNGGGA